MENYGHLLLCPVCKELITHPVLLPCQHSVCYGCARSQILAAETGDASLSEVSTTPRGHENQTPTNRKINQRRRLESTPSESSVVSCSSSKRDSGIETSPSRPSTAKGHSFVSTASSSCSSGSNETCQQLELEELEENTEHCEVEEPNDNDPKAKSKSNTLNPRRVLPKFYSSPRLNGSPRQTTSSQLRTMANGVGSKTKSTSPRPASSSRSLSTLPAAEMTQNNGNEVGNHSSVMYTTTDMVHFETSIVDGNEQNKSVIEGDCEHPTPKSSTNSTSETPKSAGGKQRKQSRKNSKPNYPFSPSDLGNISMTSFSSPPSSGPSMSARRASQPPSGGMRRANSATALLRSSSLRSSQSRGTDVIKRSKVKSLYCLTCEADVELGKLGIKGLFRNFALESIVERFRTAAKAAVAIRCGYCKPPASDATKSCLDCKLSYCNQCYKNVHVWGTKKAQHEFVGPTNNFSRPKVMLCPEHGTEAVNMYCNRCQHSVCRACKSRGGAHANHPIVSVKNAYKESKDRLYSMMDVLKNKKESMDDAILDLENNIKRFEAEEVSVRDEIHSAIDEMHKLLELKRTQLLEKADYYARNKENEMRQNLQNLKNNVMYSSVMAFAEEVLLETDPAYFLQTIKMVETRVREAIEHMTKLPAGSGLEEDSDLSLLSDGSPSMLRLHLNLDATKIAVEKLDFIKRPGTPVLCNDFHSTGFRHDSSYSASSKELNDIRWHLDGGSDADFFQLQYWQDGEKIGKNSSIESHQCKGTSFAIPASSGLLKQSGSFSVKVRGVNDVGFGPWSETKVVSAHFLRREDFRLIPAGDSHLLHIEADGREARHCRMEDDVTSKTKFSFMTGDEALPGREHYWEVEASGTADFHFIVGLAKATNESRQFINDLEPDRSALLYCGARDCYAVECSGQELESLPLGKNGMLTSNLVKTEGRAKTSNKMSSALASLKPLKQLKNSLLRRSSLTGSTGNISSKKEKKAKNDADDVEFFSLANGGGGLVRSSSVTSLPSVLRSQSSVDAPLSRSSSQWNIRSHVGLRCFRIGVEMIIRDDDKVEVLFHDASSSTPVVLSSRLVGSDVLPVRPVLAIAGAGQVRVI